MGNILFHFYLKIVILYQFHYYKRHYFIFIVQKMRQTLILYQMGYLKS